MITLITGTPGQGKTVQAVWDEIRPAVEAGRPVYYNGIPKLKLPAVRLLDDEVRQWSLREPPHHFEILSDASGQEHQVKIFEKQETASFLEFREEGHEVLTHVEEGSLIVIDEAQRIFRPMGTGVAIPDYLAYLEYHRHHGIDFVLSTQHPKLIHVNCRALVGRHIHLRNGIIGRVSHEWSEWTENPHTKSTRSNAITRRNKLPKAAFDLFESASIHVKPRKRVPMALFAATIPLFVVPIGAYALWHQMHKPVIEVSNHVDSLGISTKKSAGDVVGRAAPVPRLDAAPAVLSYPPLEYAVSNKVDWSHVAGCAEMRGKVTCFDDSGVKVLLPQETARAALLNGWPGRSLPHPLKQESGIKPDVSEPGHTPDKMPEGGGTTTQGVTTALNDSYRSDKSAPPSY